MSDPTSAPVPLPPYATVADLRSCVMTHTAGELFNPPALTNFLGSCQAALDPVALRFVTFPPYSHGDSVIGRLTLNGICPGPAGVAVSFVWQPDRIERTARLDGFMVRTRTVLGVGRLAAAVAIEVENPAPAARALTLRLRFGDGIIRADSGWNTPYSPQERSIISTTPWEGAPAAERERTNRRQLLKGGQGVVMVSQTSPACSLQALAEPPDRVDATALEVDAVLGAGERRCWHFYVGVGPDAAAVEAGFADFQREAAGWMAGAETEWNRELAAAFTPGNDRYSGHLPRLHTANPHLRAIYLTAVLNTVYLRRETPRGRTYTTLMPCYWVTTSFINDWSLNAWALVLLDPACVRRQVELWLERDINRHFGTEYVTGGDAGNWYSCNDFAMTKLISVWLRFTGDYGWLQHTVGGLTVAGHLRRMAAHYRALDRGGGLADFGDRNSLLECVGSYVHEVASLNAAAVWILREVASLLEQAGESGAAALRAEATALMGRVQALYVPGRGVWRRRDRAGGLAEVRHAWDFVHLLNLTGDDLTAGQRAEMAAFFERELMTPSWMRALSPLDDDVDFSLRPDHQWNGSYPAWVALAGCALRRADRMDLLRQWLPGLAASANQGPYSQAHFAESYAAPESGGARKAPSDWPFINDWAILAGGAFLEMILAAIFGVEPGLERLAARPLLAGLDPNAVLEGLHYQGSDRRVDARGVT